MSTERLALGGGFVLKRSKPVLKQRKFVLKQNKSPFGKCRKGFAMQFFMYYCARYSSRQRPESLMSFACSLPT